MSVPSTSTIVARLRASGAGELAADIEECACSYTCSQCGPNSNPGIALGHENPELGEHAGKLIFYCPSCSGKLMQPEDIR